MAHGAVRASLTEPGEKARDAGQLPILCWSVCPSEQRQECLDNSYRLPDLRTVILLDHTYSQKADGLLANLLP